MDLRTREHEASTMDAPVGTDVSGVFLYPQPYERIVAALRAAVDGMASPDGMAPLAVPPVISRAVLERSGYVRSFPQLVGTVHTFEGSRREWLRLSRLIGTGDWHQAQGITDVVLLPAACYHVYPLVAGTALPGFQQFCVHATCFRQEASAEPGRLRSFRMSELVYVGSPGESAGWRDAWLERLVGWLRDLGLPPAVETADDPFFGTGDQLMRDTQREQQLKWELRVPVADGLVQAVASCNRHLDHFGAAFDITVDGQPAHSACVAFGLDRIALALTHRHGADARRWPEAVRELLPGTGSGG
jgi:seryl-tRNA synthetase